MSKPCSVPFVLGSCLLLAGAAFHPAQAEPIACAKGCSNSYSTSLGDCRESSADCGFLSSVCYYFCAGSAATVYNFCMAGCTGGGGGGGGGGYIVVPGTGRIGYHPGETVVITAGRQIEGGTFSPGPGTVTEARFYLMDLDAIPVGGFPPDTPFTAMPWVSLGLGSFDGDRFWTIDVDMGAHPSPGGFVLRVDFEDSTLASTQIGMGTLFPLPPVTATLAWSGSATAGGPLTYTLVVSNFGPSATVDNPGDEVSDVLPANLTLVGATASSGTVSATPGGGTVGWNGSLPAGSSVTITIAATISPAAQGVISTQATLAFDADFDGTNEPTGISDDPTIAGLFDPTQLVVGGGAVAVPALSGPSLGVLGFLLLLAAWRAMQRRTRAS